MRNNKHGIKLCVFHELLFPNQFEQKQNITPKKEEETKEEKKEEEVKKDNQKIVSPLQKPPLKKY